MIRAGWVARLLALISLSYATGILAQLPAPPTSANPPESSPESSVATLDDPTERLQVDVVVGDSAHYRFPVDTASTRSVIADRPAQEMHLARGAPVDVQNIGGTDRVASVLVPRIAFADLVIRDVHAPALSGTNLGSDGLIGLDMLKNQRLTVDFLDHAKMSLTASDRSGRMAAPIDGNTIIVKARSRFGELILTDADIDGHKIAVVIDTGSQDSVGNAALRALVEKRLRGTEIIPIKLISVTGRKIDADWTTIGRVRVGGLALANLGIAFADAATFRQFGLDKKPAILLGMGALRLFDSISIDFPRREIRFVMAQRAATNIR